MEAPERIYLQIEIDDYWPEPTAHITPDDNSALLSWVLYELLPEATEDIGAIEPEAPAVDDPATDEYETETRWHMNDVAMYETIITMLAGPPASVAIIMAIGAAARAHSLEPLMYYRQIWAESRFNPEAVNPKSGCLGLGQMNPKFWPEATTDVEGNLELSAAFMEKLLERYDDDYRRALAAYNFGPANVDRVILEYGEDNDIWFWRLPTETRKYVRWIIMGDK